MRQKNQVPGCVKYGCVGCLSIMALGVGLIFLVSAIHLSSEPEDPRPEVRQAEHDLPPAPDLPGYPLNDAPEIPQVLPLPELEDFPEPATRAGRIVLDLKMGDFTIRPGPAGEPIRVEADYDASSFELSETFTPSEDGDWTYEVSFGSKRGWLGMILGGGRHNVDNEVELIIPRGYPVDIVGEVGMGELEADLGGLWIRRVDLEFGAGDHFIEFRDPLPFPMESFRTDASIGSVEVRNLGDASPRSVEIDHGIGELFLDLKGAWRGDSDVEIDFGIGECRLWLPDDIHVDIDRASVSIGESSIDPPSGDAIPADAPTMRIEMSGSVGEVRIEY